MFWTIVTMVVFGGGILLYAYARFGGSYGRFHGNSERMTSSEKLRMSKTHDAAFFDGESEDYAEHMSRLRQYGGA
ncbi:hypothetical protein E4H12_10205 [Candidatus Thorarchaeota archaeon]|nr:MAG: hypothetical protein E4H12_10205 [Candidatus Thorarchaeota archaeon]